MKFTLGWLKDHLETDASLERITEALTGLGLEVEGVSDPAAALAPFTVARVVSAEPHPNADKLRLCMVDTGAGEPVQVVCGAPNARGGMLAVFAAPGVTVPATGVTLRVAAVRGVESRGMLVSERELGLSEEHDGIIELAADAPVGARYVDYAGLGDPVIEVAITPNRQDCMGVHGIARDLAAAGVGVLRQDRGGAVVGEYPCPVSIATEDAEGCPAFLAQFVRSVKNGPSPAWMQRRLRAIGLRPISALVDITNYITHGWGRPLHVYDAAKIEGGLIARPARAGEQVAALNGRTYTLAPTLTVIADARGADDIGGIMGGIATSVSDATTDVLIECAYFDPARTGRTGRALGINSDARARFERGVDPGFVADGLALATRMVLDLCGGEASEVAVAGAVPDAARTLAFDPGLTARLAGVAVEEGAQAAILGRLGFGVSRERGTPWTVTVPSWRRDIDGAADLVEEVARVHGYEHIPATPLPRAEGVAVPTATPVQMLERRVRRAAAALGLTEAITWSFLPPADVQAYGGAAWTLDNPISADMAAMRPSLVPGLVAAARRNLDRGAAGVALFEIGRRYLDGGERLTLGLLLAGEMRGRDWQGGAAARPGAYDAKRLAEAVLAAAGVPADRLQAQGEAPDWLHPGRSARLTLGPKTVLALVGELHPGLARDLDGPVAVAEIYLDAVPPARARRARPAFAPPALQAVRRDFAFLYAADAPADALLRAVRGADKAAITGVKLFDRFSGAGVGAGEVSLAVEVTLQPGEKSFTEAELEAISARIVAAAAKAGGRLRA